MAWYDKLAEAGTGFLQGFGAELPRAQARADQAEARRTQKTERELARLQKQFEFLPQTERAGFIEQVRARGATQPEYAQLADELDARMRGRASELSSAYDLAVTQAGTAIDTAAAGEVAPAPGFGGLDAVVESRRTAAQQATAAAGTASTAAASLRAGGVAPTPEQETRASALAQRAAEIRKRASAAQAAQSLFNSMQILPVITEEKVAEAQSLWQQAGLDPEQFDPWFNSYRAAHKNERDRRVLEALGGITHKATEEYITNLTAGASLQVAQAAIQTWNAQKEEFRMAKESRDQAMAQSKLNTFMQAHTAANEALWTGLAEGRFDAIDNAIEIYTRGGYTGIANAIAENRDAYIMAARNNKVEYMRDRAAAEFTGAFASQAGRNAAMPGMDGQPADLQASLLSLQEGLNALAQSMYPQADKNGGGGAGSTDFDAAGSVRDLVAAGRSTGDLATLASEAAKIFAGLTPEQQRAMRQEAMRYKDQLPEELAAVLGITPPNPAAQPGVPTVPQTPGGAEPGTPFDLLNPTNAGGPQAARPRMPTAPDRPSPRAQVQQGRNANPKTPRALTELAPQQGMTERMRQQINRQRAMRGLPPLTSPIR